MRRHQSYMKNLEEIMRKYPDNSYDPNILDVFVSFFRDQEISDDLIDLMFNYEIIRLVAIGLSNKSISSISGTDESDIQLICERFYNGFGGWEVDLDYNPLHLDGMLEPEIQRVIDNFKIHRDIFEEAWK